MEKDKRKLYEICFNDRNIGYIVSQLRQSIKLTDHSIQKCIGTIKELMNRNLGSLRSNQIPRNREEFSTMVKYLNEMCCEQLIDIIIKKYPDMQVNRRRQASRVKMERDIDTYGNRENNYMERPYGPSKRVYDEDSRMVRDNRPSLSGQRRYSDEEEDRAFTMQANDIGYGANDESYGGYAPAFSNHSITGLTPGQQQAQNKQMAYNNPPSGYDNREQEDMSQRMQRFKEDRDSINANRYRPEEIDFSLDSKGKQQFQERQMKKRMEEMQQQGMLPQSQTYSTMTGDMSSGMPDGMAHGGGDDFYASILAAGAPINGGFQGTPIQQQQQYPQQQYSQQQQMMPNTYNPMIPQMGNSMQQMGNPMQQTGNPMQQMGNYNPNIGGQQQMGSYNPNIGGQQTGGYNPNIGGQQQMGGYNQGQQTEKSMKLQNDYERFMAERNRIDIETGQPAIKQTHGQDTNFGMQPVNFGMKNQFNPMEAFGMQQQMGYNQGQQPMQMGYSQPMQMGYSQPMQQTMNSFSMQ